MIDVLFANEIGARRMIGGDNAARITQMRYECEIESIVLIDFVDRHQRALQHLARHHCVRSRSGKYEAERDGRLCHEEARELDSKISRRKNADCHLVSSIRAASHLGCSVHKKVAGIALTSLATVRHTPVVR
jgi:hypothetical protein